MWEGRRGFLDGQAILLQDCSEEVGLCSCYRHGWRVTVGMGLLQPHVVSSNLMSCALLLSPVSLSLPSGTSQFLCPVYFFA